ncbi:PEGA domain-containing protein [bacterium]|nr:PEGA domain-containing protein [bacterium]
MRFSFFTIFFIIFTMNLFGKELKEVSIETIPKGVTVIINGKVMGKTPFKKKIPKSAKLTLKKFGYITVTQKLSNKKNSYSFTLVRKKSRVDFKSTPTGATINLNGKNIGKTPKKMALDGDKTYIVIISHKDKKTVFKEKISPIDHTTINAELRDKEELKKIEYDKVFSENRKSNNITVSHSFKNSSEQKNETISFKDTIKKYLPEITNCFFKEFSNKTDIPAQINISYQIYPDGKVHKVVIEDSNYRDKEDSLNFCVISVFQKIQFPKQGEVKNGSIPIEFSFE